jgi:hypothetical protein
MNFFGGFFMRYAAILGALALSVTSPAFASTVLTDDFNGENSGNTALNYTSFTNWGVTTVSGRTNGSVDVVGTPNPYGITCAGGSGSCVDLDGSTSVSGTIFSLSSFAFAAGQLITLSFDLSGNQRNAGIDGFFTGFLFGGPRPTLAFNSQSGAFTPGPLLQTAVPNYIGTFANVAASSPFQRYTISIIPNSGGTLRAVIGQDPRQPGANDNNGPLVDNISLSIGAVPEPSTWAMMILGFGLVGASLRRRRLASPLMLA